MPVTFTVCTLLNLEHTLQKEKYYNLAARPGSVRYTTSSIQTFSPIRCATYVLSTYNTIFSWVQTKCSDKIFLHRIRRYVLSLDTEHMPYSLTYMTGPINIGLLRFTIYAIFLNWCRCSMNTSFYLTDYTQIKTEGQILILTFKRQNLICFI